MSSIRIRKQPKLPDFFSISTHDFIINTSLLFVGGGGGEISITKKGIPLGKKAQKNPTLSHMFNAIYTNISQIYLTMEPFYSFLLPANIHVRQNNGAPMKSTF